MSKRQWDTLLDQLGDIEAKDRRKAAQRLAATRDPAVIPHLVEAYHLEDDETVRNAIRDALAFFKGMQMGAGGRKLPVSNQILTRILAGLAVLFFVSLLLNGLTMVLGSGGDDSNDNSQNEPVYHDPTNRDILVKKIETQVNAVQQFVTTVRQELDRYNTTGEVVCDPAVQVPPPLAMDAIDQNTYRDLALVANKLDSILLSLQLVDALWNHACTTQNAQMTDVIESSSKLDLVESEMVDINNLLQNAIINPAPTIGPTQTPIPTPTNTPEPTTTPEPGTPTDIPSETPPPSEVPTDTPEPTATDTLVPTLPFPNLDYSAVTTDLRQRIMTAHENLQSQYGNGILDYWNRAQSGEALKITFCTAAWPDPFTWTDDQRAALQAAGVADPQLEQAVTLYNAGLALAFSARDLYEPSCTNQTLSETASQGIVQAEAALEKLQEAQTLIEEIRNRPAGP